MSKWNKAPSAPEISQEFKQNQERRKQMIIEAAKRRKQKEKKQQQIQQKNKKDSRQALSKHKQQKKDAYIKYLRNNMHDKYQDIRRNKKEIEGEIRSGAKWKKKNAEKEEQQQEGHLEALDLEVKMNNKSQSKAKQEKKKVVEEFEKDWCVEEFQQEWGQKEEDLLSSKLLDSLDLDFGTVNRQIQVKKLIRDKKGKQNQKQIKKEVKEVQEQVNKLKELIGYESVVFQKPKNQSQKGKEKPIPIRKAKPQTNQVQTFNELKHKKEAKIMNWAQQQQQQADDLFSNCSSRPKSNKALRQLNQELKHPKPSKPINPNHRQLTTIEEESSIKKNEPRSNIIKIKPTTGGQKVRGGWNQRSNSRSVEKPAGRITQGNFNKKKDPNINNQERKNSIRSRQAAKTVSNNFGTNNYKQIRNKTNSRQKRQESLEKNKRYQVDPLVRKPPVSQPPSLPPLPYKPQTNNSLATYDHQFDVQSFIRQDLMNLNQNQRRLQQQLRDIHIAHKNSIKQTYQKHNIKTDYKHSSQLNGEQVQYGYRPQSQINIEQSLQNLDNMLIRRQILSRESNAIREDTQENEEDSKSFINPFSNSNDLCNQVLQLAKNVSRFQQKLEEPRSNGYFMKAKKNGSVDKGSFNKSNEKEVSSKWKNSNLEPDLSLCESQQVEKVEPLGIPPVIEPVQKIHVNQKLLMGLLLDDDQ